MTEEDHITTADVIGAAAESHDVDMDQAIVATDPDEESNRIYILEERPRGYRLIQYGMDAAGEYADEDDEPIFIPHTALHSVKSLLHGASMHQAENSVADETGAEPMGLKEVAEGMGLTDTSGQHAERKPEPHGGD